MIATLKEVTTNRGFTIVELLIVIVVIGIIAAISLVAYNGIQDRANNAKTLTAVNTYVKGLMLYAAQNGTYPVNINYPCLGPPGTTCGASGSGCFSLGASVTDATFTANMATIFSRAPELSSTSMKCSSSGNTAKGGLYYSADGLSVTVQYFLKGLVSCQAPASLSIYASSQAEQTTDCRGTLPQP
jgi:prepilin-type N-terminal cleavage/methylation domain-containing protein